MNAAWPQDGGTIVSSEKGQMDRAAPAAAGETEAMRTESLGTSYLALPDGPAPYPGVVVIHEASGLNDNIRDICRRFAAEGYAALGVDLFEGRNRAACMARMFIGGMARNLNYYGVPALKAALGRVAGHPEVAGIPYDLRVYPGAKHSFFNDQWRNYHAAAAADSWQRVLAFFAEHVRGSPAAAD